jgi:hypothetical protein
VGSRRVILIRPFRCPLRYTEPVQEGVSVDLDSCGGHRHGEWPYHYHPQLELQKYDSLAGVGNFSQPVEFAAMKGSPAKCWARNVSG